MAKTVHLICLGCPLSCSLEAETDGREVLSLRGNTCETGAQYARKELIHPTRSLSSLVRVTGGTQTVVSVKTAAEIPKEKIFDCIHGIKSLEVAAPVHMGDVLLEDVAGTGIAIVATRSVPPKE